MVWSEGNGGAPGAATDEPRQTAARATGGRVETGGDCAAQATGYLNFVSKNKLLITTAHSDVFLIV